MAALLSAKDAEIEDMKLGGAKVSRKALITDKFVPVKEEEEGEEEEEERRSWEKKILEEELLKYGVNGADSKGSAYSTSASTGQTLPGAPGISGISGSLNHPVINASASSTVDASVAVGTKRSASSVAVSASASSIVASSASAFSASAATSRSACSVLEPAELGAREKAVKIRKKRLGL